MPRLTPADLHVLRRAALGPALLALPLALAGIVLAIVRWRWWPEMPRVAPALPIALALGLVALGLVRRARHLLARRERQ